MKNPFIQLETHFVNLSTLNSVTFTNGSFQVTFKGADDVYSFSEFKDFDSVVATLTEALQSYTESANDSDVARLQHELELSEKARLNTRDVIANLRNQLEEAGIEAAY